MNQVRHKAYRTHADSECTAGTCTDVGMKIPARISVPVFTSVFSLVLSLAVLHCPADNSAGRGDITHPVLRVFR